MVLELFLKRYLPKGTPLCTSNCRGRNKTWSCRQWTIASSPASCPRSRNSSTSSSLREGHLRSRPWRSRGRTCLWLHLRIRYGSTGSVASSVSCSAPAVKGRASGDASVRFDQRTFSTKIKSFNDSRGFAKKNTFNGWEVVSWMCFI